MTVKEFLDCDTSYYDRFWIVADGEAYDRMEKRFEDYIISEFCYEDYDDMHLSLTIYCYSE